MSDLAGTEWAHRWPGLSEAAAGWLSESEERREKAAGRAERLLATPFLSAVSLARVAQLTTTTAPQLLPAVLSRDSDAVVATLADVALRGGPTYVKIGQLIATVRGLVPDAIADAFAACRDAVPPASTPQIQAVLHRAGLEDRIRV